MDQDENVLAESDRPLVSVQDTPDQAGFHESLLPVLRDIDEELADTRENPREHVFSDEDNS